MTPLHYGWAAEFQWWDYFWKAWMKSGSRAVTSRWVSQVPPKTTALELVGLAPGWESQLILRCFLWEVQESLSLSWKDFPSKKVSPCTNSVLHWTHSKARCGISLYLCVFFPLFSVPLHKLLRLQVKFKQIWEWEGKWVSETPSKAFKLGDMGERGEWRCKSWGNQPTFVLMLPRAACVE